MTTSRRWSKGGMATWPTGECWTCSTPSRQNKWRISPTRARHPVWRAGNLTWTWYSQRARVTSDACPRYREASQTRLETSRLVLQPREHEPIQVAWDHFTRQNHMVPFSEGKSPNAFYMCKVFGNMYVVFSVWGAWPNLLNCYSANT